MSWIFHKFIVSKNLIFVNKQYVEKYKLINNNLSLNYIHNPKNASEIKQAKMRIIYEELFNYMFKINYLKCHN